MTKLQYMDFHAKMCQRMMEITKAKNADYSGAGDDPFSNFRQIESLVQIPNAIEIGFLTRMSDKMSRIGSFVAKGSLQVKDESVQDTLLDLANYSILFAGLLESKKTKTPMTLAQLADCGAKLDLSKPLIQTNDPQDVLQGLEI